MNFILLQLLSLNSQVFSQMDDAETQVDQLTPLMDTIKKEAGLAQMEER